jgi:predicted secreted protein
MFTKYTLKLVTIILLVTLTGCGAKTTPTQGTTNSQSGETETYTNSNSSDNQQMLPIISGKVATIQLDAKVDGTAQQLKVAEVMAVTLESNITTGYSWFVNISDSNVLVQMGEPVYTEPQFSSSTPVMGAPGKQTFYLQAVGIGTTTVTLEYKRGFEPDVAPEKSITFTVEVK